jgi:hypothetical protein
MKREFKTQLTIEKEKIIARTQSGLSATSRPFRKYSERWAEIRESKGLQTQHVDLTYSGKMLSSIRVQVIDQPRRLIGRLYFGNNKSAEVARIHNEGLGNMPRRQFFALPKNFLKNIISKLRKV